MATAVVGMEEALAMEAMPGVHSYAVVGEVGRASGKFVKVLKCL